MFLSQGELSLNNTLGLKFNIYTYICQKRAKNPLANYYYYHYYCEINRISVSLWNSSLFERSCKVRSLGNSRRNKELLKTKLLLILILNKSPCMSYTHWIPAKILVTWKKTNINRTTMFEKSPGKFYRFFLYYVSVFGGYTYFSVRN